MILPREPGIGDGALKHNLDDHINDRMVWALLLNFEHGDRLLSIRWL